jgi:hypothetical protein
MIIKLWRIFILRIIGHFISIAIRLWSKIKCLSIYTADKKGANLIQTKYINNFKSSKSSKKELEQLFTMSAGGFVFNVSDRQMWRGGGWGGGEGAAGREQFRLQLYLLDPHPLSTHHTFSSQNIFPFPPTIVFFLFNIF